jgi:Domain of unknown function (DUF4157)
VIQEPRKKAAAPSLERSITPSERIPVALPFRGDLEHMFRAELANVRAYVGAEHSLASLGARAAAEDNIVAFAERSPRRSLVAHEVAHVLQARTSAGDGDSEQEAQRAESAVAAGTEVPRIATSSSGIQLAEGDGIDETWLGFQLRPNLEQIDFLAASPLGKFIHFDGSTAKFPTGSDYFASDVLDAIFPNGVLHAQVLHDLNPYLLPETDEQISTRARMFSRMGHSGPLLGLRDALAWEIVNVLVRRILESIPRVLPAIASLRAANKYAFQSIDVSNVAAIHPMDTAVAKALSRFYFTISPEYQLVFGHEAPKSGVVYENVTLKPAERKLYHWVLASPPDATAFEVAKAMFGREDMAFRLTARPPLWGFHHDALAEMTYPGLVDALNKYAGANHPNPKVLNPGDRYSHQVPTLRTRHDNCGVIASHDKKGSPKILELRKNLGNNGLEQNNYLVLPVGNEDLVEGIAAAKHDQLAKLSVADKPGDLSAVGKAIRVFYYKDGKLWLSNGSSGTPALAGSTVQEAMGESYK